jgi:hypothetical protein
MSSTPVTMHSSPVTVKVVEKKVSKTLPMKHKTIQYAIVGYLKRLCLDSDLEEEKVSMLIKKLPLFDTVEEQIKYYDDNFDLKHIEQTYIKPMIQAHKKSLKPQKEKKVRKPREKKPKQPTVLELIDVYEDKQEISNTNDVIRVSTPVLEKKKTLKNPDNPKKPRGRKAKETEVTFAHNDEEIEPKKLESDLKEESYVVDAKEENKKKRKVPVKKKAKEEKPKEENEEPQYWLMRVGDTKYWTTDENEENGDLYSYSYDEKDEDGDPAPGKKVGTIENGKIVFI